MSLDSSRSISAKPKLEQVGPGVFGNTDPVVGDLKCDAIPFNADTQPHAQIDLLTVVLKRVREQVVQDPQHSQTLTPHSRQSRLHLHHEIDYSVAPPARQHRRRESDQLLYPKRFALERTVRIAKLIQERFAQCDLLHSLLYPISGVAGYLLAFSGQTEERMRRSQPVRQIMGCC